MGDNDIIVLNSIIDGKKKQIQSTLTDAKYFEQFTFEQILKDYELSDEELLCGNTDSGDDGGVDGFFVFVNHELLEEDSDLTNIKRNPVFEVFLIQAKTSNSFSELAVQRVTSTVENIFDLTKDMNRLKALYNAKLIEKANRFKEAYLELAALHPTLKVYYFYVSKGDTKDVHPKVKEYASQLKYKVSQLFTGSETEMTFYGSRELLDLSRMERSYTLQLDFLENYLSRGANNYIVLSSLTDYFKFVTDESSNLRRYIFESNVRDYQGNVEVNRDMEITLTSEDGLDFWWLNNGITILATKASVAGKRITLDNVQIVNGLQTTTMIYNYLRKKPQPSEVDRERSLLVRIIVTDDSVVRDRIIKATNFQTAIPPASLRATDRIQRDIEDYFYQQGWYYDRRKNFYKNLGKPVKKIISIPFLAQSVMAMILKEPDNARARPSTLIKREVDYSRVFSGSINPDVYLFCAKVMRLTEFAITSLVEDDDVWKNVSNLKFHVAMIYAAKLCGTTQYSGKDIKPVPLDDGQTMNLLAGCFDMTMAVARQYAGERGWTIERLAKNPDFVDFLLNNIDLSEINLNIIEIK